MAQKASPNKKTMTEDPRYVQALQNYEAGLRAMQEHKFDRAKPLFQKVLTGPTCISTSATSIWNGLPPVSSRLPKSTSTMPSR